MSFTLVSTYIFFLPAPPTTEIYTLSLHDALPIFRDDRDDLLAADAGSADLAASNASLPAVCAPSRCLANRRIRPGRSEEHTSELQSRRDLVCRLLLEKKKNNTINKLNPKNISDLQ